MSHFRFNLFKRLPTNPKGGIREMAALALPMMTSHACDIVMTFTDRLFLSCLSPDLMNASMAGGVTVFMMASFFLGLIGYTTALVAQHLGAGQKEKSAVFVVQAILIAFAAYPLILLCRPLAHLMFERMGLAPGQLAPQKVYFNILLGAVLISLLRQCLSSFFSGIGKTRVVMLASLTAMIVNMVANYILVFGKFGIPAFGIQGSAYGTIIGGFCGLVVLAFVYFGKKNAAEYHVYKSFHFDWAKMEMLWRFGSPSGAEFFLNLLAFDLMILIFQAVGPIAATASTIMFNWDMVSFVPLVGIEISVTSLVGRYMGGRDPNTAHKAVMSGLKLGAIFSTVVLIFFVGFGPSLVHVFLSGTPNALAVLAQPTAVYMIRMASLYVLIEAMFIVFIGALRGAGDTLWAMCFSVGLHWAIVLMLYVALHILKFSTEAAWTILVVMFFASSTLVYFRYRSGRWKEIRIVADLPKAQAEIHDDFHEGIDL